MAKTWGEVKNVAPNRAWWKELVSVLSSLKELQDLSQVSRRVVNKYETRVVNLLSD